ncbi:unnamed protein product, partial [Closterium sp. NIES-64]
TKGIATVMPRDTASKKGDLRVSILTTWLATGAQRHNNIRARCGAAVRVRISPHGSEHGSPWQYASSDDWRRALARVVPAVVVLRVTVVRAFDTESANSSYATGFIVDRRRGIILTNRHVVKPGPRAFLPPCILLPASCRLTTRVVLSLRMPPPLRSARPASQTARPVVAEAMFLNREEVPVHPIYRDPVHDFGFFHFDPAAVQFLDYQDIPLAPEAAAVGLEIRVVGNDSGEKVSILAGTIARLDRDAPVYKKDGKSSSASAFFLPLDRVVRALGAIQACFAEKEGGGFVVHKWRPPVVTRGTLQGFDETRRLGLRRETEAEVRREAGAAETGLLVVDSLVPGGPAEGRLEPGDILVRVNGKVLTQFLALEAILDDTCTTCTPSRLTASLELSGGVLHALSYQQARNFRFPCGLVYVAEPGYMLSRAGVPRFAIIQKLADQDVPDLETFLRVFARLEAGARDADRVCARAIISDGGRGATRSTSSARRSWCTTRRSWGSSWVDRNTVAVSVSDIMLSFSAYPVEVPGEVSATFSHSLAPTLFVVFLHPVHNFAFVAYDPSALGAAAAAAVKPATLKPSPALAAGRPEVHLVGLSRSQAVTSRQIDTVSAVRCNGVAVYTSACSGVEIDTDFGQSFSGVLADDSGAVRALWAPSPPSIYSLLLLPNLSPIHCPLFKREAGEGTRRAEAHEEGGKGGEQQQQQAAAGTENSLLMNGRLWAMPRMRVLEAELAPMLLSKARSFGLSEQWVHVLARADPVRRQVLRVKGTLAGSAVAGVLQQGDMLLAVNGRPVTCFADVEAACCELDAGGSESAGMLEGDGGSGVRDGAGAVVAAAAGEEAAGNGHVSETGDREPIGKTGGKEDAGVAATTAGEAAAGEAGRASLSLTILRQGREQRVQAGTDVRHGFGTTRVVNWAGCLVQDPHPAVRATGFLPSQGHGAYVASATGFLPSQDHGAYVARRAGWGRAVRWLLGNKWSTGGRISRGGFYCVGWCHGSPAHRYGLYALHWIVEINGRPVPDLDALVAISQELEHGAFVRVKVVHLNGKPRVLTLKQDLHYWPTWELRFVPSTGTWQRTIHKIQK